MFEAFINYLDKFGPEVLVIQAGFLVILSTLLLWLWFANRRKYHHLKHAIPANVVKNYLDSIIQNSTSLKSSLFRGGGLDVAGSVPSVMPLTNLMGGEGLAVSGAPSTALLEELNQKKALIASLEAQLSAAQSSQREIEQKFKDTNANLIQAEARIKELEALLRNSGGGDDSLKAELKSVTKERDEYRDRLKEFEIISDDLANLKRLQQENEQLKRSLGMQGGSVPKAEASAEPDVAELLEDLGQSPGASGGSNQGDSKALEDFLSTSDQPSESAPVDVAASLSDSAPPETKPKSDKTPEDLLSEFEKMLG